MEDLLQKYQEPNDEFTLLLQKEIKRIWETNPDKLLTILYRIDIKESIVKEALLLGPCENGINLISEAIINRMKLKLQWRNRYPPEHFIE